MKKKLTIVFLLIVLLSLSSVNSISTRIIEDTSILEKTNQDEIKLSFTMEYITNNYNEGLDALDGLLQYNEEPEWWYKVHISTSKEFSEEIVHEYHGEPTYTWMPEKPWDFTGIDDYYVFINIEIYDNDDCWAGILNEQADISCRKTEVSNEELETFSASYNLKTNTLTKSHLSEENWEYISPNSYIIDGSDDGTQGHENDDNDVKAKFSITDTYEPIEVILSIEEDLNKNTVSPGQEITFNAGISNGKPPYSLMWLPWRDQSEEVYLEETIDENTRSLSFQYRNGDHGAFEPNLIVTDDYLLSDVDSSYIIVNQRPLKPTINLGNYYLQFKADVTDPDGDNLQYQWKVNGNDLDWQASSVYYKDKLTDTLQVRVRDDPIGGGNYEKGLVSSWSDVCEDKIRYDYRQNLLIFIFEEFPILLKFF